MDAGGAGSGGAAPGGVRVRDVVRAVVAEFAPEELPVVDGLAGFDDSAVVRRLSRKSRGEPLGFGLAEVAVVVTPVAWLVLDQVAQQVGNDLGARLVRWAAVLIRRLGRRNSPPATIPPLSAAQLADVRRAVQEKAVQRGLSEKRAVVIADAVVAELATGSLGRQEKAARGDSESGAAGAPGRD